MARSIQRSDSRPSPGETRKQGYWILNRGLEIEAPFLQFLLGSQIWVGNNPTVLRRVSLSLSLYGMHCCIIRVPMG